MSHISSDGKGDNVVSGHSGLQMLVGAHVSTWEESGDVIAKGGSGSLSLSMSGTSVGHWNTSQLISL